MNAELFQETVAGIPLAALVFAWVYFLGQMGVQGKAKLVASLLSGLVLGGLYQYAVEPPVDLLGWLRVFVYGLGLGLLASGTWDALKAVASKAVTTRVIVRSKDPEAEK